MLKKSYFIYEDGKNFVLDTKTKELFFPLNEVEYKKIIGEYGLDLIPDNITDIQELSTGIKKPYWLDIEK